MSRFYVFILEKCPYNAVSIYVRSQRKWDNALELKFGVSVQRRGCMLSERGDSMSRRMILKCRFRKCSRRTTMEILVPISSLRRCMIYRCFRRLTQYWNARGNHREGSKNLDGLFEPFLAFFTSSTFLPYYLATARLQSRTR